MVMQSPPTVEESKQQYQCSLNMKLESLEQSFASFSKLHSDISSKNHDRIISKADVGHKKMDEITEKLQRIEKNISNDTVGTVLKYPGMVSNDGGSKQSSGSIPSKNGMQWFKVNETKDASFYPRTINTSSQLEQDIHPLQYVSPTIDNRNIVVKGLGLHITAETLSRYLLSKGVSTLDCQLLTTYENAQSLTYKITLRACDQDTVKDPAIWPDMVTVQPFKQKRRQSTATQSSTTGNANDGMKMGGGILKGSSRKVIKSPKGLSVRFTNEEVHGIMVNHFLSDSNHQS